ncbi:hypothetical protein ACQBAU_05540 [Propionibacteriaceae bacterium Y2011]
MTGPGNTTLGRGAMQHWSDAAHHPAGDSAALRHVVSSLAEEHRPDTVLVAGPHVPALVQGLAALTPALTVLTRGRPDADAMAELLAEVRGAESHCGDLDSLVVAERRFDLVVALDDVSRIPSAESAPRSWAELASQLTSLVSPTGHLVWAVENDLGLHRVGAQLSAGVDGGDSAWAPVLGDPSRPTGADDLREAMATHGLHVSDLASLATTWHRPRLFRPVGPPDRLDALLMLRDAVQTGCVDPARVVLPAARRGLLDQFVAGWLVLASGASAAASPRFPWSGPVVADGDAILPVPTVAAPDGTTPLLVSLLEQCVARDVPGLRRDLRAWRAWLEACPPDERVTLDRIAINRAAEPESPSALFPFLPDPGSSGSDADEVAWRSLGQLVGTLRRTGLTHPWPAYADDAEVLATVGDTAGLTVPADLTPWLPEPVVADDLPHRTRAAVIQRLQEQNAALTGREQWLRQRLAQQALPTRIRRWVGRRLRAVRAAARGRLRSGPS